MKIFKDTTWTTQEFGHSLQGAYGRLIFLFDRVKRTKSVLTNKSTLKVTHNIFFSGKIRKYECTEYTGKKTIVSCDT